MSQAAFRITGLAYTSLPPNLASALSAALASSVPAANASSIALLGVQDSVSPALPLAPSSKALAHIMIKSLYLFLMVVTACIGGPAMSSFEGSLLTYTQCLARAAADACRCPAWSIKWDVRAAALPRSIIVSF